MSATLAPADVAELLRNRLARLTESVDALRAELAAAADVPRLFLVEDEYRIAMTQAEAEWTRSFLDELSAGTFPHLDVWQHWHESGDLPPEFTGLADRGADQ